MTVNIKAPSSWSNAEIIQAVAEKLVGGKNVSDRRPHTPSPCHHRRGGRSPRNYERRPLGRSPSPGYELRIRRKKWSSPERDSRYIGEPKTRTYPHTHPAHHRSHSRSREHRRGGHNSEPRGRSRTRDEHHTHNLVHENHYHVHNDTHNHYHPSHRTSAQDRDHHSRRPNYDLGGRHGRSRTLPPPIRVPHRGTGIVSSHRHGPPLALPPPPGAESGKRYGLDLGRGLCQHQKAQLGFYIEDNEWGKDHETRSRARQKINEILSARMDGKCRYGLYCKGPKDLEMRPSPVGTTLLRETKQRVGLL